MNPIAQETVVAWLHDAVEDTIVTLKDIENDFGTPVADAVDAITSRPDQAKAVFYARVKANPIALTVKAADIADNTDSARLQPRRAGRPGAPPEQGDVGVATLDEGR